MKRIGLSLTTMAAIFAAPSLAHAAPLTAAYIQEVQEEVFDSQNTDMGAAIGNLNPYFNVLGYQLLQLTLRAQGNEYAQAYTDNGQSFLTARAELNLQAAATCPAFGSTVFSHSMMPAIEGTARYSVPGANYTLLAWYDDWDGSEVTVANLNQPNPLVWTDNYYIGYAPGTFQYFELPAVTVGLGTVFVNSLEYTMKASLDVNQGGQFSADASAKAELMIMLSGGPVNLLATLHALDDSGDNGRKAHAHAGAFLQPSTDVLGNPAICAGYDALVDFEKVGEIDLSLFGAQMTPYQGFPFTHRDDYAACYDLSNGTIQPPAGPIGQAPTAPPAITLMQPSDGSVTGGSEITIYGTNFDRAPGSANTTRFYFNGVQAPWVFCPSQYDWCSVQTPPGAAPGPVSVSVSALGKTSTIESGGNGTFTYDRLPKLLSAQGNAGTTFTLALDGPAPPGGAAVSVVGSDPSVVPQQTVTIPGGETAAQVTLQTSPASQSETVSLVFSYDGTSASSTMSVTPPPACVPLTCSSASSVTATCGSLSDGCSGTLQCGTCSTGVCSANHCCPTGTTWDPSSDSCIKPLPGGSSGGGCTGKLCM
jgi:hypothetical protein